MSTENWDRVYTVNEYYDGPKLGVADYHGKPHIYQKQFSEEDDEYTDRFLLTDIDRSCSCWSWRIGKSGYGGTRPIGKERRVSKPTLLCLKNASATRSCRC
jgi:hypothetical protein